MSIASVNGDRAGNQGIVIGLEAVSRRYQYAHTIQQSYACPSQSFATSRFL
jgi:hypothetical protein